MYSGILKRKCQNDLSMLCDISSSVVLLFSGHFVYFIYPTH